MSDLLIIFLICSKFCSPAKEFASLNASQNNISLKINRLKLAWMMHLPLARKERGEKENENK
jgi:hypothetical protein